jgi:murein L,D-transpeptidase YcbB/YkuD
LTSLIRTLSPGLLGRLLVAVAALVVLPWQAAASAAAAAPPIAFQLPFTCGQQWRLDTWAHAPALDMVREPNQVGTEGAPVLAPASGTVRQSFYHSNAGNVIQINHGQRYFTTYLHLQSRDVSVGQTVQRGQLIGRVGRTGPTSNNHPHLHFELAYDADNNGSATWGNSTSERIRPWFNGVEYGQADSRTWRNVTSNNCGGTPAPTCSGVNLDLTAYPLIQQGSNGSLVKAAQCRLIAAGHNPGEPDGDFGPNTTTATMAFQSARGLTADGDIGPRTWTALLSYGSTPALQNGSTGADVSRLQRALTAALGRTVGIDGDFGPDTEQAVRDYQTTRSLGVDGNVGPQTWAALQAGR